MPLNGSRDACNDECCLESLCSVSTYKHSVFVSLPGCSFLQATLYIKIKFQSNAIKLEKRNHVHPKLAFQELQNDQFVSDTGV